MVKLLIKYTNNNNKILELNKKNKNGEYPLFSTVDTNNV